MHNIMHTYMYEQWHSMQAVGRHQHRTRIVSAKVLHTITHSTHTHAYHGEMHVFSFPRFSCEKLAKRTELEAAIVR